LPAHPALHNPIAPGADNGAEAATTPK
jgi:hypothetical protein